MVLQPLTIIMFVKNLTLNCLSMSMCVMCAPPVPSASPAAICSYIYGIASRLAPVSVVNCCTFAWQLDWTTGMASGECVCVECMPAEWRLGQCPLLHEESSEMSRLLAKS